MAEYAKTNITLKTSLQIYCLYRLLQILAVLTIFLTDSSNYLGTQNPYLFLLSALSYLAFCLGSVAQTFIPSLPQPKASGILFIFFIDVLAVSAFIHFSGGVYGSLGVILVVIVATSGVLLEGQLVLFIAALASLSILGEQIYLFSQLQSNEENLALTGTLGLALFGAALIVQQVAQRLRDSEQLVSEQAAQVETLERINEQIIERMPNGVIVIDRNSVIQFMNTSAWRLFDTPKIPDNTRLSDLSSSLGRQVQVWLDNPNKAPETFRANSSGPSLNAYFSPLSDDRSSNSGTIIFVENASFLSEQAQKMKLASLGTLTAGIAHEIRNPLGAISHAAQLLDESDQLEDADKRLSSIIQQHSIRMNRIIENVLELSRQKPGTPEDINIDQWLKEFVKEFKTSQADDIEISYQLSGSKETLKQVDSSQLSQVLTNLCENGIRYSYANTGRYHIHLGCSYDELHRAYHIDVVDQGKGVPHEQVEHIFEPFFTTDAQGSGLGLYIAKELCQNNRSTLSYLPRDSEGSCFRISFIN